MCRRITSSTRVLVKKNAQEYQQLVKSDEHGRGKRETPVSTAEIKRTGETSNKYEGIFLYRTGICIELPSKLTMHRTTVHPTTIHTSQRSHTFQGIARQTSSSPKSNFVNLIQENSDVGLEYGICFSFLPSPRLIYTTKLYCRATAYGREF